MIVCTHVITRARRHHSGFLPGNRFPPTEQGMDGIQSEPFRVRYLSKETWWSQGLARQDPITEFPFHAE